MIPNSDFYRLVLRFRVDDPDAKTPLGAKFGCSIPQGKSLLSVAKDHHLNVVGVRYMCMYMQMLETCSAYLLLFFLWYIAS